MARLRPFDGSCFFADTKGTLAKFTAKFTAKFDKVAQTKCVGIDLSGTDLICSRPCGGAFGAGAPINRDELGNDVSSLQPSEVWTFVGSNGGCDSVVYSSPGSGPCPAGQDCAANCSSTPGTPANGWTSASAAAQGAFGDINATSAFWTRSALAPCSATARLYCVQR